MESRGKHRLNKSSLEVSSQEETVVSIAMSRIDVEGVRFRSA